MIKDTLNDIQAQEYILHSVVVFANILSPWDFEWSKDTVGGDE